MSVVFHCTFCDSTLIISLLVITFWQYCWIRKETTHTQTHARTHARTHTNTHTHTHTHRETQTDRHTNRHKHRNRHRHRHRQTGRQTDRQIDRRTHTPDIEAVGIKRVTKHIFLIICKVILNLFFFVRGGRAQAKKKTKKKVLRESRTTSFS
jgi:hypothetical protein